MVAGVDGDRQDAAVGELLEQLGLAVLGAAGAVQAITTGRLPAAPAFLISSVGTFSPASEKNVPASTTRPAFSSGT